MKKRICYTHEQFKTRIKELKKVRRVIIFNQKFCLKSYIDMNTDLRKKGKK